MNLRLAAFLAIALSALALPASADGLVVVRRPPSWPLPLPSPEPHPVFAPLEVAWHHVEVSIDGQVATTRVDQEFVNPGGATLEGDYIFPIPAGAHVDRFSMRIGDRDVEAEMLDAAKARGIYEEIVRTMRDPALLEYAGRGAFRVRIFPIEPHSRKRVQLAYTELLRSDGGLAAYTCPLATGKFSSRPVGKVSVRVEVRQPAPIKALYSPSHVAEVRRDGARRATIGWEASETRPDRDFQLLFSTAESGIGIGLLAHAPGGTEPGAFLLLVSPGFAGPGPGERPNPKDVVLVLDTSGSMAGRKLEQARKALAFCVENLGGDDRFEVVRFATETEACFGRLAQATRDTRETAQRWLDGVRPIGGTAIHEALQEALRLRPASGERPFVVVFLTDGQPTVGETGEDKIVASIDAGSAAPARVFCFGIGTDVNTHLLHRIAERTRAAAEFVLPEEDLELKVSSFFTKIREPLLTNLEIAWPAGVRVAKEHPRPLPDLFRGEQLVLTGLYNGAGEGEIVVTGTVAGRTRRLAQRVKFPAREPGNEFVARLWATRRVGWLLDEIRLRGESAELRAEIVDLARRHAIVTPYTSFLIVEDEVRRGVPAGQRSLPGLEGDRFALDAFGGGWANTGRAKSGDAAARDARANAALRNAEAASGALDAAVEESKWSIAAQNTAEPAAPAGVDRQVASLRHAARVVAGKAFYRNGSSWIDSDVQARPPVQTVRLQFASAAYFEFLAGNAWAAPWLALGSELQFTVGDTLYDIVP